MTRDEFIEKAKLTHGARYDYSLVRVDYKRGNDMVEIICPEHGVFQQSGGRHIQGCGCKKCAIEFRNESNKLTTLSFIIKAKAIHKERYDYSLTNYIGSKEKVIIICPEHGEFNQRASTHLSGSGCPICSMINTSKSNTLNNEKFIEKAIKKHGLKYDYSLVEYNKIFDYIKIICPEHGEFTQKAKTHLEGSGCQKCAGYYLDNEYFIEKAKILHGNKYDYSKISYNGIYNKIIIICPEHGEFLQRPSIHLSGKGCPKCVGKNKNTEDFITQAKIVHGERYDYSETVYVSSTIKVNIVCIKHGKFTQSPGSHLCGSGCPSCKNSNFVIENKLYDFFANNLEGVEIDRWYSPKFLKRKSLDIYLPKYNIGIECQGQQHFIPVKYFGGEKTFIKIQIRDNEKYKECTENGIKLYYFSSVKKIDFNGYIDKVYTDKYVLINDIKKQIDYET